MREAKSRFTEEQARIFYNQTWAKCFPDPNTPRTPENILIAANATADAVLESGGTTDDVAMFLSWMITRTIVNLSITEERRKDLQNALCDAFGLDAKWWPSPDGKALVFGLKRRQKH